MNEITNERCRAAMLTPAGRGAVATIRLRGSSQQIERAGFAPAADLPLSEQPIRRLWFGFWGETPSEEVVLGRLDEREWELHCHGGYAAVARILNSLRDLGWETSGWKELFARNEAFPVVEYREALSLAPTWKTTETLLRHTPERFVATLNELTTDVDSTDWSDERSRRWTERWEQMLAWRLFGLHLTIPFRVILAGEPNVGKSSLLNRLAGFERAIVHDRPGTTRDVVRTLCAFEGWPCELSDTAGIRTGAEPLESLGIEKSLAEIAGADLVLFLVDVSRPPVPAEEDCLQNCPRFLRIGHKADLPVHPDRILTDDTILVSSLTETGLEELIAAMIGLLVPEIPTADVLIPISIRQVEWIERLRFACEQNDPDSIRRCCKQLLKPDTVGEQQFFP